MWNDTQSGFRENLSCETAINLAVADWKKEINNGKLVVAVFLDQIAVAHWNAEWAIATMDEEQINIFIYCEYVEKKVAKKIGLVSYVEIREKGMFTGYQITRNGARRIVYTIEVYKRSVS